MQNDNDYRTNGFGNLKYAMGNFKNDIFGDYIRYTHASCHSYVVVNIDGKILVVNGENDAEIKEIYQRISEKVSKGECLKKCVSKLSDKIWSAGHQNLHSFYYTLVKGKKIVVGNAEKKLFSVK